MEHHDSEQARLLEPLSTKWIEDAAGVSRDTVAAWRRGRKPRADQWERFTATLDAWRAGLPDTTKEPPPEWATAMERNLTDVLMANRKVFVDTMATHFAQLGVERALDGPLPSAPDPETRESLPGSAEPT